MKDYTEQAQKLIDELTFGGHSWDGAAQTVTDALATAYAQGAFDARRDFAAELRSAISEHMKRQTDAER